ncbi:helix-turn-helix domain-containing protein [Brevibacterium casei]|nr:helix-turn-helix domain-containing protein [Brevibacterium casei]MCT1551530.1 helix-turn-helix domain-containing protein [Brevibacterium casei]MCT1560972.1 helix-turn-helix domain-containing protein [Brevibacterium casei]MCT2209289.1 helix-turn-helix domain-containing protein [Brevibacterium casei]
MTAVVESPTLERVMKVSDVAAHLECTNDTVYRVIAEGALRAIRVGRLLRVPESALAEFIAGAAR